MARRTEPIFIATLQVCRENVRLLEHFPGTPSFVACAQIGKR
jgi:hypothetical protein